jgi:hypothetical protein
MRRKYAYRGENHGSGKDNLKSLTTTPGIREQAIAAAEMGPMPTDGLQDLAALHGTNFGLA